MPETKTDQSWEQAMGRVVREAIKARTKSRYPELSYKDYQADKGSRDQRTRFHKAWQRSVDDLYYRLRSARTRRLFSSGFTQMLCQTHQYELGTHFDAVSQRLLDDDSWEDLRDILMLSLSANSYLKPPQPETQEEKS